MDLDDKVCLCFHVTRRKLVNYVRIHKPKVASQLSQCGGAASKPKSVSASKWAKEVGPSTSPSVGGRCGNRMDSSPETTQPVICVGSVMTGNTSRGTARATASNSAGR